MEVKKLKLNTVKPYWKNPRRNEETVELLKKSIGKYGFNVPLIIDKNNVIIAGHARYKALMQLGYKEVECVIVDLPPDKTREFRIADNKIAELSFWDSDKLKEELKLISDLEELVGFKDGEIDELLTDDSLIDDIEIIPDTGGEGISSTEFAGVGVTGTEFAGNDEEGEEDDVIDAICPECGELNRLSKRDLLNEN